MIIDRVYGELLNLGYSDEDAREVCRLEGEYMNECRRLTEESTNDDSPQIDDYMTRYQAIKQEYEQKITAIDERYLKNIRIGDVVRDPDGYAGVVTLLDMDNEGHTKLCVLWFDGSMSLSCTLNDVRRTGDYLNVSMLLSAIASYNTHQ